MRETVRLRVGYPDCRAQRQLQLAIRADDAF